MQKKQNSGCGTPIIAFIVIVAIVVLLQSVWIPTIPDFKERLATDNQLSTYGWIAAIAIPLIIFVYNTVTGNKAAKEERAKLIAVDKADSIKRAKIQIDRINESIKSGNQWELANDYDTTVRYVTLSVTSYGAYEYLYTIAEASFFYYGNKYPNRRGALLEDVIREELDKLPVNYFK